MSPEQFIDKYRNDFLYLFRLQKSGRVNMYGAGQYLQDECGLERAEAREVLKYWMANYDAIAAELKIKI